MRLCRSLVTVVLLFAAGCHRGPKTPEEGLRALERAIAGGDALAFYSLLDEKTRWSVESVLHDQKLMRTIISAKYPEAEAQKALQPLEAADERDAAHFFARLDSTRHITIAYRKRLGSVSGPVMTKPVDADNVWAARQDGMPFHFHHDKRGWYFSELGPEWALEKDRTIHALHTVQENAKLYQKADNQ
jgi:hypothetical protein